ncbi:GNAT family N-acetyltransferase [Dyadobacter sp. CY345]|uniref:GNAT family N-acetyltransferase n=1 Tax=Dyadobacter sp. CY345 TaxID=2909335 RepID=UPI001F2F3978|nr:GNAT family N-acetyltransferase [Dyadobacter sp. CY345]MCF2447722.1 GNAT family N-acetyltransferase [Dyadobacter sp. CY345]
MEILKSKYEDIDKIFELYQQGTEHQKTVAIKHWKGFERSLIEKEISEERQYKIVVDQTIVCVFAIDYNDPLIWGERDKDPSIYIHRIATNPDFRGQFFVKKIVEWAKNHAKAIRKKFIRMDTGSGNEKLNSYYERCGFKYLGVVTLGNSESLPAHYKHGASSLFEIQLKGDEINL